MENQASKDAKLGNVLYGFGITFLFLAIISLVSHLIFGQPSISSFLGLVSAGLILVVIGQAQRNKAQ